MSPLILDRSPTNTKTETTMTNKNQTIQQMWSHPDNSTAFTYPILIPVRIWQCQCIHLVFYDETLYEFEIGSIGQINPELSNSQSWDPN